MLCFFYLVISGLPWSTWLFKNSMLLLYLHLPGYLSTLCCSAWSTWLFQHSVLFYLIYLVISAIYVVVPRLTSYFCAVVPDLPSYFSTMCSCFFIYLVISVLCAIVCLFYLIISVLFVVVPNLPGYFSTLYSLSDIPDYFNTLCCSAQSTWLFQCSLLLCLIYLLISVLCAALPDLPSGVGRGHPLLRIQVRFYHKMIL